jgi:hypothetical protein
LSALWFLNILSYLLSFNDRFGDCL